MFLGLLGFEGISILILLLWLPSDQKTAWILGYSHARIFLLLACLGGILFFSSLFVVSLKNVNWTKGTAYRIETILKNEKNITIVLGILSFAFILSIIYLGFVYSNFDFRVPKDAHKAMEQVNKYLFRFAPLIIWIVMLSGQALLQLSLYGYGTKARFYRVLQVFAVAIFPILLAIFWGFNQIHPYYYNRLTNEDNFVEWGTVVFLLLAAVLAILHAVRSKRDAKRYFWFFVLFAISCSLFAIEEISWGQRIFGLESPEYFLEHSDQQEINIHNIVNEKFSVRTKHIAAWVLLGYGVALPMLARYQFVFSFVKRLGIVIPPLVLIPGFIFASVMTWDRFFSGQDEEVAEFFFSILIFLVMVFQYWVNYPHATSGQRDDPLIHLDLA